MSPRPLDEGHVQAKDMLALLRSCMAYTSKVPACRVCRDSVLGIMTVVLCIEIPCVRNLDPYYCLSAPMSHGHYLG